jgi:hypothetical protein
MSLDAVRCPGFWNNVNNARRRRTMITQRAKLRKLAFISTLSREVARVANLSACCS